MSLRSACCGILIHVGGERAGRSTGPAMLNTSICAAVNDTSWRELLRLRLTPLISAVQLCI